jgi:hypothetical protein
MEPKSSIPGLWMTQSQQWSAALVPFLAIFCVVLSAMCVVNAQAGPCVNLVSQMERGEESFAFISPPGFQIRMMPYLTSSGVAISGLPSVVSARQTEGWGEGIYLSSISLAFDFGSLECVYIRFRYPGGDWYLNVNGQGKSFSSLQEIDGSVLGGVRLYIYPTSQSAEGYLILSGRMGRFVDPYGKWTSLIVGGQQLVISDVCAGG